MSTNKLNFLKKSTQSSTADVLGIFAVSTFGLHIFTFIILFLLYGSFSRLSKKPPPTLVELNNGKSVQVTSIGSKERTSTTILNFVKTTFTLMLNWSGTIPISNDEIGTKKAKPDPGVSIKQLAGSDGKVTIAAWQSSYALSSDFRKEFIQLLAEMTPAGVFEQNTQVVFIPLSIQQPIKISQGKWKVRMISNLNIFDTRSNIGEVIPFNKEIFIKAVEIPENSPSGGLELIIKNIRASGLEIYAIRDFKQENL